MRLISSTVAQFMGRPGIVKGFLLGFDLEAPPMGLGDWLYTDSPHPGTEHVPTDPGIASKAGGLQLTLTLLQTCLADRPDLA